MVMIPLLVFFTSHGVQHFLINYNIVCDLASLGETGLDGPDNRVHNLLKPFGDGLRDHFVADIT